MTFTSETEKILEAVRVLQEANPHDEGIQNWVRYYFPELKEIEDEKIRRFLIDFIKVCGWSEKQFPPREDVIAWLKKQGECEFDCPQNHQDVNRPNGCIVLEDFNGGEGFYKVHLDYLNKKQVEEIEEMIRVWNKELKTPNENIKDCIGICLTDADEQRFKDFNTNLKDCLAWLEKQGNPTEDELEALRMAAYEPTKNWSEKLQSLYEKLTHCEQKPVIEIKTPEESLGIDSDAFIEKAAGFLYNYNQKQVLKHGARATLGCGEYTINVDDFRKYMEGDKV